MTIENKYFDNLDEAINFLTSLTESNDQYLFRGHKKSEYRLCTTLNRFTSTPHEDWSSDIDLMLQRFRSGLAQLGLNPCDTDSRLDWMEYARHHGVPTPCIDFTYSPYVALFFAFDGVREKHSKPPDAESSVVYALNILQIATIWAKHASIDGCESHNFKALYDKFCLPRGELFKDGFPAGVLQLIPYPGKHNSRMQRQFGALLYDTLDYTTIELSDLEKFIESKKEPPESGSDGSIKQTSPTLTKVYIKQQCVSSVFSKLELMGITGGSLYMDASGVALDVINSYNYESKSYLRGVEFPKIDESKLHDE